MKKRLKIVFFGLGSIGKRHALLILKNFKHEIFAFRSKSKKSNNLGIKELYSWKQVSNIDADVAFITNPTYMHIDTAIKCAKLGMNLFIEKPIDCSDKKLNRLANLIKTKHVNAYIAYCLRFHPIIKALKKYLSKSDCVHANIIVSSHLPLWRKGKDYRNTYSASASRGGGVILDLSHEIDYIQYLFGDIRYMKGVYGKISKLEVNCEDYADIIIGCKKAVVNLHMNFFSMSNERSIHIDFDNSRFLKADLVHNTLLVNMNGKNKIYRYNTKKNDVYLSQLVYFFRNFKNINIMNNFSEAAKLFKKIIDFKSIKT